MIRSIVRKIKLDDDRFIERAKRSKPDDIIMVTDTKSNSILGKIVNINEAGMQLIMDSGIPMNQKIELKLVFKNSQGELQQIVVISELLWTQSIAQSESVVGGFKFNCKNFKSKFRLKQFLNSL